MVNCAIGGRRSRTSQFEGRWEKILAELKKGDIVIIQFGHNDVGKYNDPAANDRKAHHGEDDWAVQVPPLDGKTETVQTFGWYTRKYGTDARLKGSTVIFCSMVPHKDWKDGRIVRKESETFVKWTSNAAKVTNASFINLNEMVAREFEKLGSEKADEYFADKRPHSTPAGALLNAGIVIFGLRGLSKLKIERYLSRRGKSIQENTKFVVENRE